MRKDTRRIYFFNKEYKKNYLEVNIISYTKKKLTTNRKKNIYK